MSTIKRPAPEIIEALSELGTDAVTSTMEALGVRRTFMEGSHRSCARKQNCRTRIDAPLYTTARRPDARLPDTGCLRRRIGT